MAGGHIGGVLRRLRGLLGADCAGGPTDGELLRRYVLARDEGSFEALLRRHGPMVLGVCRRLLGSAQDVDDAFQATFLILIRKAPSIGDGERVANWLYGVAYRVAVRARVQAARRHERQRMLTDVARDDSPVPGVEEAVRVLLDEEVSRLPARYREAIVCCYLEGRTQEETARLLGWPKGTVATRLNRARELLRNRLTRRGLCFSAGTLATLLPRGPAEGALPPALVATVMRSATRVLSGGSPPPGAAALVAAVLREGCLRTAKVAVAGTLAVALAATGVVIGLGRGAPVAAPKPAPRVAEVQPMQAPAVCERPLAAAQPPADVVRVLVIVMDGGSVEIAREYCPVSRCDCSPGFSLLAPGGGGEPAVAIATGTGQVWLRISPRPAPRAEAAASPMGEGGASRPSRVKYIWYTVGIET
jgi:RNA polymerase sigma factor (sigma-70 family)